MTDEKQHTQWLAAAKQLGQDHANNAASWVCKSDAIEPRGKTRIDGYRRILTMMRDGDPEVYDFLPQPPNLSGEWAGELTPQSLAVQIVGSDLDNIEDESTLIDELSDAYEEGVSEPFESAC